MEQANNPLANMTALNFHNYYMPKLADAPEGANLNNTWMQQLLYFITEPSVQI